MKLTDLLLNQRTTIGFFLWRFVDGESSIGRSLAVLQDREYDRLMEKKVKLPRTRFGAQSPANPRNRLPPPRRNAVHFARRN